MDSTLPEIFSGTQRPFRYERTTPPEKRRSVFDSTTIAHRITIEHTTHHHRTHHASTTIAHRITEHRTEHIRKRKRV